MNVDESSDKKKQKRGGKAAVKAKKKIEPGDVKVGRVSRGKKKSVTHITGLLTYEIDLKKTAKLFGGKFACGTSSNEKADEIVIQGIVWSCLSCYGLLVQGFTDAIWAVENDEKVILLIKLLIFSKKNFLKSLQTKSKILETSNNIFCFIHGLPRTGSFRRIIWLSDGEPLLRWIFFIFRK